MKKYFLLLSFLLVAFAGRAELFVDELTSAGLGLESTYAFAKGKTFTTETEYEAYARMYNNSIGLNSGFASGTTNYFGIYNTTSVGNVRRVEVIWANNTTDGRIVTFYGKSTPFVNNTVPFSSQGGTYLGWIKKRRVNLFRYNRR